LPTSISKPIWPTIAKISILGAGASSYAAQIDNNNVFRLYCYSANYNGQQAHDILFVYLSAS
jgi:hypothetical protein